MPLTATRRPLLFGAACLLLAACHKEKIIPEPDPCLTQKANSLTFRVLERTGTPALDTVYNYQDVTFEAPSAPYTSYEWLIGSSPTLYTTRRVALFFPASVEGQRQVRLIARRPPNKACFPKDDGVDTLARVIYFVPRRINGPNDLDRAPILGRFQGATTDAPKDTFTVRIYRAPDYAGYPAPPNPRLPWLTYIRNIKRGCQSPYFDIAQAYNGVEFYYDAIDFGCGFVIGKAYLTTRDSIRIDYSQDTGAKKFLGRRLR